MDLGSHKIGDEFAFIPNLWMGNGFQRAINGSGCYGFAEDRFTIMHIPAFNKRFIYDGLVFCSLLIRSSILLVVFQSN